jgi:hypothetical protein
MPNTKQVLAGLTVLFSVVAVGTYWFPSVLQQYQTKAVTKPTFTLPQLLYAKLGVPLVLSANDVDADKIEWLSTDAGLQLLPPELLADSTQTVVVASKPGSYNVYAIGIKGQNLGQHQVMKILVVPLQGDSQPSLSQPGSSLKDIAESLVK